MLLNSEKVPRPSGHYIYIYIERERERRLAKVDEGSQNSPWDMYGLKHYNQVSYEIPVGVELVLEFWGERVDTTKILV